jgi:hypothetical protein
MEQAHIRLHQRLEGVALFVGALYFYLALGNPFPWFAVFLFSIDIVMLGYLINNRIGAHLYNIGHNLLLPVALLLYGIFQAHSEAIAFSLIWISHIGFDRMCGYGFKYETGFRDTHLGKIGSIRKK